jgi:predicted phosphate transport protein (TIGR00153 family)
MGIWMNLCVRLWLNWGKENNMAISLFRKTKQTEEHVTTFLMNIMQAGYLLLQVLENYMEKGVNKKFIALKNHISTLEGENDDLRRQTELNLYKHMLLPDMRSDIIDLLEACDKIINKYESDVILWSVEKPQLPKAIHTALKEMTCTDLSCVGSLVGAVKSFFAGFPVDNEIQNVYNLEHQVDLMAFHLKEAVFADKRLSLARQLQLKDFIYSLEKISDMAEDAADKLKVMVAKHTL